MAQLKFTLIPYADISTRYLAESDLDKLGDAAAHIAEVDDASGSFFYVTKENDVWEDHLEKWRAQGMSSRFIALMTELSEQGVPYVRFDASGCDVEGFEPEPGPIKRDEKFEMSEGWLFANNEGVLEIQRWDEAETNRFASDHDAAIFVQEKARSGSAYHAWVLDQIHSQIVAAEWFDKSTEEGHEITLTVQVSVPVTLAYDAGNLPSWKQLKQDALENFLAHPAIDDKTTADLDVYVDSIGNGRIDLVQ
jgi:hypothetical protein